MRKLHLYVVAVLRLVKCLDLCIFTNLVVDVEAVLFVVGEIV